MSKTENNILLFSITLCWAAGYIFIKGLPAALSDFAYLTLTCGIAAILLTIVFWKRLRLVTVSLLKKSFLLSAILTLNLLFDKLGIDRLPSSTSSVFAATSILIVPMLMLFLRKYPTRNNIVGACAIMIGVLVMNGFDSANIFSLGAGFMLLSALTASAYTLIVDRVTKEEDPLLLSMMQMWMSTLISFVIWFIQEPTTFASLEYTNQMLSSIFILAFFAKAYAYAALMYSQKYSDPISVTVIASTEPVVTLVLAVLIPSAFSETFTLQSVLGVALIMLGAIISGTDFLDPKKRDGVPAAQKGGEAHAAQ